MMRLCVVQPRVLSVDAIMVMAVVPHLESAFSTFGSVTQEMIASQSTETHHAKQLKFVAKIARISLINVQQMKVKCFAAKFQ